MTAAMERFTILLRAVVPLAMKKASAIFAGGLLLVCWRDHHAVRDRAQALSREETSR